MKVLFICTGNSCRSILCEAITNHLAKDCVTAYSAGSQPAEQIHPLTIKYLQERGMNTEGLESQSWDDFESIEPDLVITVCDNANNEACPVWFGDSIKVHWGLPDPSKLAGTDEDIKAAFFSVMATIEQRIRALLAMDLERCSVRELQPKIQNLAGEA